jgi:hypothetical protein
MAMGLGAQDFSETSVSQSTIDEQRWSFNHLDEKSLAPQSLPLGFPCQLCSKTKGNVRSR